MSKLSEDTEGPQIFLTDPAPTLTSQIWTVESHPPLKKTAGSLGRHLTQKTRLV
jgi:hypothetical protein